jgi:hypothetical protein
MVPFFDVLQYAPESDAAPAFTNSGKFALQKLPLLEQTVG